RLGRRKPFISLGFFAAGVAGLGLAMSPSPEWMVVARFVSGISACAWVAFTVLYSPNSAREFRLYRTLPS
ncbi:MAG: MFS transporter, partial [Gemmatimonadetes bacterium]|nr:MFS transporter [Gemmatimonadota bacterium]